LAEERAGTQGRAAGGGGGGAAAIFLGKRARGRARSGGRGGPARRLMSPWGKDDLKDWGRLCYVFNRKRPQHLAGAQRAGLLCPRILPGEDGLPVDRPQALRLALAPVTRSSPRRRSPQSWGAYPVP